MREDFKPESLLSSWLSSSFLVTTLSLLFYHMSKLGTITIDRGVASLVCCILICLSLILSTIATITYLGRTINTNKKSERNIRFLYGSVGALLIFTDLVLVFTVVKDLLHSS